MSAASPGQKRGHVHIHAPRQIGIRLRSGNSADGGAMNDELRLVFLKFTANGGEIEQIKLVARQRPHAPARGKSRRGLDEIISNQPVRAGDPGEFHCGGFYRSQTRLQMFACLARFRP